MATFPARGQEPYGAMVKAYIDEGDTDLPVVGSYTYNPDGTVASTPDGSTFTYNSDGTINTVSNGGVTRTFTYNSDGTIASVA